MDDGTFDARRLAPIDNPFALARAVPPGEPADPWPPVRDILDEARSSLSDDEFAVTERAVRWIIAPLMRGFAAEWPEGGAPGDSTLPDGAATVVRDVRATLCLSARHGGPGSAHALVMLGRRLDTHLDDLVAAHES